jgi:hypothetical protein
MDVGDTISSHDCVHVLIFPSYILDHDWFLQSQNC